MHIWYPMVINFLAGVLDVMIFDQTPQFGRAHNDAVVEKIDNSGVRSVTILEYEKINGIHHRKADLLYLPQMLSCISGTSSADDHHPSA